MSLWHAFIAELAEKKHNGLRCGHKRGLYFCCENFGLFELHIVLNCELAFRTCLRIAGLLPLDVGADLFLTKEENVFEISILRVVMLRWGHKKWSFLLVCFCNVAGLIDFWIVLDLNVKVNELFMCQCC
jgi:hypothetical protein